jgi:CRP/FNR family cyclic AMP-dependent transcriptional regulator
MAGERSQWSSACSEPRLPRLRSMRAYLLDADDDLAAEFDLRVRHAVRQGTTVRVLQADVGECQLSGPLGELEGGFGLLVLDGLIAFDTCLDGRTATELLGAGDLLGPLCPRPDAMLACRYSWRVLSPARLALLDAEFAQRVQPWPQVSEALLRRASRRTCELDALRAIASQPRLEVRLDLLFWHLAARWGRVERGAIRVRLPLTHRLLGQLIAAERPSVSHALHRLAEAGLITGEPGDWHLRGTVAEHLEALSERAPRLTLPRPEQIAERRRESLRDRASR